jgi:hypothetical protein
MIGMQRAERLPQAADQVKAVESRHPDIREHEGGFSGERDLERFVTVPGLRDFMQRRSLCRPGQSYITADARRDPEEISTARIALSFFKQDRHDAPACAGRGKIGLHAISDGVDSELEATIRPLLRQRAPGSSWRRSSARCPT